MLAAAPLRGGDRAAGPRLPSWLVLPCCDSQFQFRLPTLTRFNFQSSSTVFFLPGFPCVGLVLLHKPVQNL